MEQNAMSDNAPEPPKWLWQCSKCTFVNHTLSRSCAACKLGKKGAAIGQDSIHGAGATIKGYKPQARK